MKPPNPPNLHQKAAKPYFFYGHRKPSQNRPVVYGGLFSNRQSLPKQSQTSTINHQPFDLRKWDPDLRASSTPSFKTSSPSISAFQRLSPIARFVLDAFRKNQHRWGPEVVAELNKLRRITPDVVAEVLKVSDKPTLAAKFFHWAGKQRGYKHTFASYNAFAYCLNRNGKFRAADQLPELMESQGKPPSEKQFEVLIRMHSDSNRGLRVHYVYEKMKRFGLKPRVFLYNRIMDALIRTGHLDLALSVYKDFREDGSVEESVTFMILIKGLCKAGRTEEVFQILQRMREKLCKPDVFAYTAMIRAMVSEGNFDGSLRVWDEMRSDKVEPDAMAYVTLVTGLCKGNKVERAYRLFKEMKEKGLLIDRGIYGVLIDGFVGDGKLSSACDLLKDLVNSGYNPDLGIYSSIIRGLCDVKQVDKAYKLFQVAVREELEPDFETIMPMLVCYAAMRRMNDFCQLLAQMQKLGYSKHDGISKFFSFVTVKQENITMAMEVYEILKPRDCISVPGYGVLMEALCKIGESEKALKLFDEMKTFNLEPDSAIYSIAVRCFVDKGEVQEASSCHNKIIEMGCIPSVAAYSSLAKGLCKIGEIDAAMMLVRDCLGNVESGPMQFKYTLTILHVCRFNDCEKVMEVLEEMLQESMNPDEVIYSAIISGMCKHGTIEEARKIFAKLQQRRLLTEADAIAYDDMLLEHMKRKTADLVLSGLKFFGLEAKLKAKGSTLLTS